MKSKTILLADDMIGEGTSDVKRSISLRKCTSTLAEKLNSSVELVHVEDLTLYPVNEPHYKNYIRSFISNKKFQLKKAALSFKVPTHISFLEGYPSEEICRLANKKNKYEMVALSSHGRTGIKRALLGSVAEEIVRNARIPVLVLGPNSQKLNRNLFLKKPHLLVATDLTSNSTRAEAYALILAKKLSAEVTFFHSLWSHFPSTGSLKKNFFSPVSPEEKIRLLEKRVKKFRSHQISASFVLDETSLDTSYSLAKYIDKTSPSFLIMGTHGRNLLKSAFLGSTAREMILKASTPTIIVRSH